MISTMLVLVLLASIVAPALAPRRSEAFIDLLMTVGAVLGIGKVTEGLVTESIDKADGAAKDVMREAADQIDRLLRQIEATYGNALNTTLDSLDRFTGQQLAKVASLLDQINQKLMEDVAVIQQAVLDLLNQLNQMIQQTLTMLEDLIVVGVRGATFVIDKTTYNMAFLIAVVLLAVGLLAFTKLLWSGKVPRGWVRAVALGFMAFYVILFTGLLIPQTRVYAITMVGQADKLNQIGPGARIFSVTPGKLSKGVPADLVLIGANFDAGGAPHVILNGQEITPTAWSDTQVMVHLSGSQTSREGPQSIFVKTADGKQSSPAIVEFAIQPAPAQLVSWRLVPTGQMWSYREFGPVTVSCEGKAMMPVTDERDLRVEAGWELAADNDHIGTLDTKIPGAVPDPPQGLSESIVTKAGLGTLIRSIGYLPTGDSLHKDGIKVAAVCFAPSPGLSISFQARYTVWGKRLMPGTGTPATGGPCASQGTNRCGAYPAASLSQFRDQRPDSYTLMVTVRTTGGQTMDRSAVFAPGTAGQKLTVDTLTVWMENNEIWVKGPAATPPALPKLPVPAQLAPVRRLPIFQP